MLWFGTKASDLAQQMICVWLFGNKTPEAPGYYCFQVVFLRSPDSLSRSWLTFQSQQWTELPRGGLSRLTSLQGSKNSQISQNWFRINPRERNHLFLKIYPKYKLFSSSTNPHHPQPLIKCQFLCWKSKRRLYLTCTHIWTTPFRNIIRMVANHRGNVQPQLQIQFPQSKICHRTIHNHINLLFFRALKHFIGNVFSFAKPDLYEIQRSLTKFMWTYNFN